MPTGPADPAVMFLTCPACKARVRLGAGYQGVFSCPACGCRIKVSAPRQPEPGPAPAAPHPVPAELAIRVVADDSKPLSSAVRERWLEAEPPPEEEEPLPSPPRSLCWGVYTFPWHLGSLRVWILLALGLAVIIGLGAALHWLLLFYRNTTLFGQGLLERVVPYFAGALGLAGLWTGSYAATDFLAVIQETAGGNEDVKWPDDSLIERLVRLAHLSWIGLCVASPLALAALVLRAFLPGGVLPWIVFMIPWSVLFPVVLLGSLSNNAHWVLFWNSNLMLGLARKPLAFVVLCLVPPWLLLPCVVLGYYTIGEFLLFLLPLTAAAWSACLLIYARLIGRVAWVVSVEDTPTRTGRKKSPKRARRPRAQ